MNVQSDASEADRALKATHRTVWALGDHPAVMATYGWQVWPQPPPLWGSEDHVRALLGNAVTDVVARRQTVTIDRFAHPDAFLDYFKANYGPTVAVYRGLAGDPDRAATLDHALTELARRHLQGEEGTVMEWKYLLLTARKRD